MKNSFDSGNLVSYARDGLRIAPDAEFSLSEERSKELLAQLAAGDAERPFMELAAAYGPEMRGILAGRASRMLGRWRRRKTSFGSRWFRMPGSMTRRLRWCVGCR